MKKNMKKIHLTQAYWEKKLLQILSTFLHIHETHNRRIRPHMPLLDMQSYLSK
jgi:hypothetical protein